MNPLQFVVIVATLVANSSVSLSNLCKQKYAVMAIRASAGLVSYDYQVGEPGMLVRNPGRPTLAEYFLASPVEVSLGNGGIREAGLLDKLRRLNVSYPVKDPELVHIKGLSTLRELDLGGTQITDLGLEHLRALTELQYLGIWDTNVTDAGIQHLSTLTRLRRLDISGTQVTDGGVKRLQHALPKCQIVWSSPTQDKRQSRAAPDQLH